MTVSNLDDHRPKAPSEEVRRRQVVLGVGQARAHAELTLALAEEYGGLTDREVVEVGNVTASLRALERRLREGRRS